MPATPSQRVFIQDALVSADALRARVRTMLARPPGATPERQAIAGEVFALLDNATNAARGVFPRYRWVSNWWRKPMLDATYEYLHAAQVQMVELFDRNELDDALPASLAIIRREFDQRDPRRVQAEAIARLESTDAKRGALRAALVAAYASSDAWHRRQRSFRNILVLATVGISVLVFCVGLLVFQRPDFMPFCFDNLRTAEGAPAPAPTAVPVPGTASPPEVVTAVQVTSCPTGRPTGSGSPASSYDIVMVALMGLLGGSLAAAVSIRKVQGSATPYDIPAVLATLKVPTGALTAIAGLIAIRGDFVPGLSGLDSQEQILAYALVLGYAQQLATGFLDRRAQSLAEEPPNATLTCGPLPVAVTGGDDARIEESRKPARKALAPSKGTKSTGGLLSRRRTPG